MNIVVWASLFSAAPAFAQEESRMTLSLEGGVSLPSETMALREYWNTGYTLGAGLGYTVSDFFAVSGNAHYSQYSFDNEGLEETLALDPTSLETTVGSRHVLSLMADSKLSLARRTSRVSLYLFGGAGLLLDFEGDMTLLYDDFASARVATHFESAFSILYGCGFDISLGERAKLFLEAGYTIGFTKGSRTAFFPLDGGILFSI